MVMNVWKDAWQNIKKYPIIFYPFIVSFVFQSLALYLMFAAPQRPFSVLLAPPIRVFLGEKFLHYPYNFIMLPKLFYYANALVLISIGILMAGLAVTIIKEINIGRKPRFFANLLFSLKRYPSMLIISVILFAASFIFKKLSTAIHPVGIAAFISALLIYFAMVFINMLLVYSIPAIIADNKLGIAAIKSSLAFLKNFPKLTFALVFVPNLLYIPVLILHYNMTALINITSPEAILYVLALGILFSVVIDIFVTVTSVLVFLKNKKT